MPIEIPPSPQEPQPYLLDDFCEAISDNEGGPGDLSHINNNPGNLRWTKGAPYPFHATGVDPSHFLVFADWHTGYMALHTMVKNACLGNSQIYFPSMLLYNPTYDPHQPHSATKNTPGFFQIYAPKEDKNDPRAYAEFVAKRIKVDLATFQIKNLLG